MATAGKLRPDLRRVSLLVSMVHAAAGDRIKGEGLEFGCGYGFLLFPMALFNPNVHWTAISILTVSILIDHYSVITLSETLEHLPTERISFVMEEINRVLMPGGLLIACVAKSGVAGKPYPAAKRQEHYRTTRPQGRAKNIFGHIRIYTPEEMNRMMSERGYRSGAFCTRVQQLRIPRQIREVLFETVYRLYEKIEQRFDFLRDLATPGIWCSAETKREATARRSKWCPSPDDKPTDTPCLWRTTSCFAS